ncbi:MAG: family 1 glycosylhydrolase [Candidatus Hydrogenedentes bacterium]|nr:family 1 glycosylhydrolase [Candidatus Hydrogenedentota bacterium]
MIQFPREFLWGATLPGHPIEGANFAADWWAWEQRPGRIADKSNSQIAAGHYERYESDLDLARQLSMKSLVFSVEWSRVEPVLGEYDDAALAHYRDVARAMKRRQTEPICALWNVTLPKWLADRGGWLCSDAPHAFARYAARVAEKIAPVCKRWIPLTTPVHYVQHAYIDGAWPPQKRRSDLGVKALRNLALAHRKSADTIRSLQGDASIGVSVRGQLLDVANAWSAWDARAARTEETFANHAFQGLLRESEFDFTALSYAGAIDSVRFAAWRPLRRFRRVLADASESFPEGLLRLIREMRRYRKPVLIAGVGTATQDEAARCQFLLEHVLQTHRAIAEGCDVRGFVYGPMLDGFEWHAGYTQRLGLVAVDRETLTRAANPAAYLLKDLSDTNGVRRSAVMTYCPGMTVDGAA